MPKSPFDPRGRGIGLLSICLLLVSSAPAEAGVRWSVDASASGTSCGPTLIEVNSRLLLDITVRTDDQALAIQGAVSGYDETILELDPGSSILPDTVFNASCAPGVSCVGGLVNEVGLSIPFEETNVGPGVKVQILSAASGTPAAGFGDADPGAFSGIGGDPQFRLAFTVIGVGATTIDIGTFATYLDSYTGTLDNLATNTAFTVSSAVFNDADSDRRPDACDNCLAVSNGPLDLDDQIDTDADGYGNACDADYNQDGNTTTLDFAVFLSAFAGQTPNPDTDHNGDGATTTLDFPLYLHAFTGVVPAVGPSGYACAGVSVPCPEDPSEE